MSQKWKIGKNAYWIRPNQPKIRVKMTEPSTSDNEVPGHENNNPLVEILEGPAVGKTYFVSVFELFEIIP